MKVDFNNLELNKLYLTNNKHVAIKIFKVTHIFNTKYGNRYFTKNICWFVGNKIVFIKRKTDVEGILSPLSDAAKQEYFDDPTLLFDFIFNSENIKIIYGKDN